jgi:hypothetical protein
VLPPGVEQDVEVTVDVMRADGDRESSAGLSTGEGDDHEVLERRAEQRGAQRRSKQGIDDTKYSLRRMGDLDRGGTG